jgi:hypothetical protein
MDVSLILCLDIFFKNNEVSQKLKHKQITIYWNNDASLENLIKNEKD